MKIHFCNLNFNIFLKKINFKMDEIIFYFEGEEKTFKCNSSDKMKKICSDFANSINLNLSQLFFIYNALPIDFNASLSEIQNPTDKNRKKMNVMVTRLDKNEYFEYLFKEFLKIINNISNLMKNIKSYFSKIKDTIDNNSVENIEYSEEIKKIIEDKYLVNQFSNIINLYNKINKKKTINYTNEIKLKYKMTKNYQKIKILGTDFVKNNIGNCKFIYNGEPYDLSDTFDYTNSGNDTFEIKLTGFNNITDMSNIFQGCTSLINIYRKKYRRLNTNKYLLKINKLIYQKIFQILIPQELLKCLDYFLNVLHCILYQIYLVGIHQMLQI